MDDGSGGIDAVMADLGANLVTVLVILLVAIGTLQGRPPAPVQVLAQPAIPLSGHAQSDLLYLRLNPDPAVLLVELTASGANIVTPQGLRPLAQHRGPWPARSLAFVFSPRDHALVVETARQNGSALQELTVPDALRAPPEGAGSGFSTAFLSLPRATGPEAFRPALLRLLTQGPGQAADGGTGEAGGISATLAHLWRGLVLVLNLSAFALSVWLLRGLYRRLRLQL